MIVEGLAEVEIIDYIWDGKEFIAVQTHKKLLPSGDAMRLKYGYQSPEEAIQREVENWNKTHDGPPPDGRVRLAVGPLGKKFKVFDR